MNRQPVFFRRFNKARIIAGQLWLLHNLPESSILVFLQISLFSLVSRFPIPLVSRPASAFDRRSPIFFQHADMRPDGQIRRTV
jgi:hypothetical protein